MLKLLKIKATRKFLTKVTSTKGIIALVMSHLDYANSILVGLPKISISQLQRVQHIAAKIVQGKNKHERSSKCLEELHLLPVQFRINFKTDTSIQMYPWTCPDYLKKLIVPRKQRRQGLRSEDLMKQLEIPRTSRHTFCSKILQGKGPALWNQLPEHIKKMEDYKTFKKHLKTFYFKKAFP